MDEILVKAFGRTYEADLVIRLRKAGRIALSLTAEIDNQAVGHILFSPLALTGYSPPHAPEDIPPAPLVKPPSPWPGCAPGSLCLLALELDPGALADKHGQVAYAPEFKA